MLSRISIKSFSLVRTKSFPNLRYYRSSHLIPLNVKEDLLQYESEFTSISNSPAVIDHIQGLASKYPEIISSVETYRKLYPFPLDDFQLNGLQSLIDGKSVIVMTPTGSGKTVVGELAIYYALMKGLRVAYTSPLKALSNQKYVDFKRKFGAERVGLMTGDVTINRDAPIIIMTTEVFRNMVYSPEKSNILTNLFMVCLDEFHYMNDAERGTVWEESVISCPSSVRLLALSATMGNVEEIHSWISTIHGPTDLIRSDYRPVPLRYYFSSKSGLLPLFIDPKSGPGAKNGVKRDQHGKLISKSCINPSITHLLQKASRVQKRGNLEGNKQRKNEGEKLHRLIPKYSEVARELMKMQKLPAIFFIFSRIGCLEAATEVLQSNLKLLSKDESKFVKNALDQFMKTHPTIPISRQHSHLLQAGVGVHHAGLIPVWKSFIEELFNANMIKVLFATETLAAGVNMPARSTVISAVSKRVDSQTVKLKTSQLLQMAGRAGRRGKDVEGSVVIMHNRVEDPSTSHRLLTSSIDGIKSHFRTSYGITAKLLQKKTLSECKSLIERGFGAYLLQQRMNNKMKEDEAAAKHRTTLQTFSLQECQHFSNLLQQQEQQHHQTKSDEHIDSLDSMDSLQLEILNHPITIQNESSAVLEALKYLTDNKINDSMQFIYGHSNSSRKSRGEKSVLSSAGNKIFAWKMFTSVLETLESFYAVYPVNETQVVVLPFGESIAYISSENDLWMALLLQHPAIAGASHSQHLHQLTRSQLMPILAEKKQQKEKLIASFELNLPADRESKHMDDVTLCSQYEASVFNIFCQKIDGSKQLFVSKRKGKSQNANNKVEEMSLEEVDNDVVMNEDWEITDAYEFAAIVASTLLDDYKAKNTMFKPPVPSNIVRFGIEIQSIMRRLQNHQDSFAREQNSTLLDYPIYFSPSISGLVYNWATGNYTWRDLCLQTSMDQGDLCRILRRTVEFLRQVPDIPHTSRKVKSMSWKAARALDRFPVSDESDLEDVAS